MNKNMVHNFSIILDKKLNYETFIYYKKNISNKTINYIKKYMEKNDLICTY
jgi:hypothetical protein